MWIAYTADDPQEMTIFLTKQNRLSSATILLSALRFNSKYGQWNPWKLEMRRLIWTFVAPKYYKDPLRAHRFCKVQLAQIKETLAANGLSQVLSRFCLKVDFMYKDLTITISTSAWQYLQ